MGLRTVRRSAVSDKQTKLIRLSWLFIVLYVQHAIDVIGVKLESMPAIRDYDVSVAKSLKRS